MHQCYEILQEHILETKYARWKGFSDQSDHRYLNNRHLIFVIKKKLGTLSNSKTIRNSAFCWNNFSATTDNLSHAKVSALYLQPYSNLNVFLSIICSVLAQSSVFKILK